MGELVEASTEHLDDDEFDELKVKLIQAVVFELQQIFIGEANSETVIRSAGQLNDILPSDDFKQLADYIKEWRGRKGFFTPSSMGKCEHRNIFPIPTNTNPQAGWCEDCGARRVYDEWTLPGNPSSPGDAVLGKLMLVATEVAEAAEAVRHEDWDNFVEELADTFIRLLDLCGTMGIDIKQAIVDKMAVNEGRETRHGKKTRL
jgi:NTP pyrophosphatase (non-canonical NTP hydrolase)